MQRMSFGCATVLALSPLSHADVIGIDSRNGDYPIATSAIFSDLRQLILDEGHSIVPVASFLSTELSPLDALILRQPDSTTKSLSNAEIDAIRAFVAGGGGLLAIGEGGGSTSSTVGNWNSLMSNYGVSYSSSVLYPGGNVVSGFVAHEVTTGILSHGLDYYRPMLSITAPAVDLTASGALDDSVWAVAQGADGAGNVAFLTDTTAFVDFGTGGDYELSDLDNRKIFRASLEWIADIDCNGNGISDDEDITSGASADCNGNGVPDECDVAAGAADLDADGTPDECEGLTADVTTISAAFGGSQTFSIDVDDAHGGDLYLLLGTVNGPVPGTMLDDVAVPLNVDGWTIFTLQNPNSALLKSTFGVLDAEAKASPRLQLPCCLPPELVGLVFHHAALVVRNSAVPGLELATNPIPLTLQP